MARAERVSAAIRAANIRCVPFRDFSFTNNSCKPSWKGGLLGLAVLLLSLGYSSLEMITKPFKMQPEISLLSATLLGSYFMEGLISAALVYDKLNEVLVITSTWLWVKIRR